MTHRVLLVANRTLGDDGVVAEVRRRVEGGATELWLVVPVTRPNRGYVGGFGDVSGFADVLPMRDTSPDAHAYDLAERRLQEALDRFGGLGVPVGGEVGDEDPVAAVGTVLARRQFEEIIVSTLPAGVSHWLRLDLPSRVQRAAKVPVTTVVGTAVQPS
jgi:GABA permease